MWFWQRRWKHRNLVKPIIENKEEEIDFVSIRFRNTKERKRLSQIEALDTTHFQWCYDNFHFVTSTTAPRLRVKNGFERKSWTSKKKTKLISHFLFSGSKFGVRPENWFMSTEHRKIMNFGKFCGNQEILNAVDVLRSLRTTDQRQENVNTSICLLKSPMKIFVSFSKICRGLSAPSFETNDASNRKTSRRSSSTAAKSSAEFGATSTASWWRWRIVHRWFRKRQEDKTNPQSRNEEKKRKFYHCFLEKFRFSFYRNYNKSKVWKNVWPMVTNSKLIKSKRSNARTNCVKN